MTTSTPKEVWLISPYEVPPGKGYRVARWENLSSELVKHGYEVSVFISDFCHYTKVSRGMSNSIFKPRQSLSIISIPGFPYQSNVGLARILSEVHFATRLLAKLILARRRPVAIVCKEPPIVVGLATLLLSWRHSCTHVSDIVDLWPELFSRVLPRRHSTILAPVFLLLKTLRRFLLCRTDGVVSLASVHLELVPARKPKAVIYNGIPSLQTRPAGDYAGSKGGRLTLVYVGTLGINYDLRTVLTVAKRLHSEGRDCRFIFAGSGPLEALVVECCRELPETIEFLGRVHFADLPRVLARADVGLMPYLAGSTVEMPDKFYDYISSGLPMITSIKGEVGAILDREGCGAVYTSEDPESLYQAILALMPSEELSRMRRNALRLAGEYSADVQFVRYREFLESLLQKRVS